MRTHKDFPTLHIIDHPLVQHKLTWLRKADTPTNMFRTLLKELTLLMGYEITRSVPLNRIEIETPLATMKSEVLAGRKPAIVPILRAGIGMADGLMELMPSARIGHVGLYRDPVTKQPKEYYVNLPEPGGRLFILCDPMLATGNSAVHAANVLVENGVEEQNIRFLALVAAPEGVKVFTQAHPGVAIYTAALDEKLDENAYIVPGLGDAGDRIFGTR
ncbi:MAG: uracil phosphoribosyltransferase [Alphaproteobacteria bacterium]